MKEKIKAETAQNAATNVRSLETESAQKRYVRFRNMRNLLKAGAMEYEELLSTENYNALLMYEQTSEYKVMRDMEKDMGRAFK